MGAVRAMRAVVRWMLPVLGGMAQQGRPTIPGPNHPFTWEMNRSTILMPCNMSGILRPSWTRGWGIVDVDWSNAKGEWAKAKPMNCEEMLADQARLTTAATPGSTVWVYRNSIKALPWFTTVRVKLTDPDYAAWFMRFSAAIVANHSAAHVPVCDGNYHPPRCSDLYHDQSGTPGYPHGDGNCAPPGCDVGSVPVGEYLFDPRAANTSVNGQTLAEWFVDEYLFDPVTGAGNPSIGGFYFDDQWHGPDELHPGPSEMDAHAVADMGLGAQELGDIAAAFGWMQERVYAAILARGKFSWNQLWNGERTPWADCPEPMVTRDNCSSDIRSLCSEASLARQHAMIYGFSPGCSSCHARGSCQSNFSWNNFTDPDADIAAFLLTRGPFAWLGHGWSGCTNTQPGTARHFDELYRRPAALDGDYGRPLGLCTETVPGSGVFTRRWSKATITFDCNTWSHSGLLPPSPPGPPPPPPPPGPPPPPPNATCPAGFVVVEQVGMTRAGHYWAGAAPNAAQCCSLCAAAAECNAWSYHPAPAKQPCALGTIATETGKLGPGNIAGYRTGHPPKTATYGLE